MGDEYIPVSVIKSYQFNPDGTRVPDELDSDIIIYEVTDDFYTTEIGSRFIEYAKSLDPWEICNTSDRHQCDDFIDAFLQ